MSVDSSASTSITDGRPRAVHGLRSGRYAERYGRHANYAALNWAIITLGGLGFVTSILLACLL